MLELGAFPQGVPLKDVGWWIQLEKEPLVVSECSPFLSFRQDKQEEEDAIATLGQEDDAQVGMMVAAVVGPAAEAAVEEATKIA